MLTGRDLAPKVTDALQVMHRDIDDATYAYDLFLTYQSEAQALLPRSMC